MSDTGQPPGWAEEMNRVAATASGLVNEGASSVGRGVRSYAALLSSNFPCAWNKNVLEIVLEKI